MAADRKPPRGPLLSPSWAQTEALQVLSDARMWGYFSPRWFTFWAFAGEELVRWELRFPLPLAKVPGRNSEAVRSGVPDLSARPRMGLSRMSMLAELGLTGARMVLLIMLFIVGRMVRGTGRSTAMLTLKKAELAITKRLLDQAPEHNDLRRKVGASEDASLPTRYELEDRDREVKTGEKKSGLWEDLADTSTKKADTIQSAADRLAPRKGAAVAHDTLGRGVRHSHGRSPPPRAASDSLRRGGSPEQPRSSRNQ